MQYVVVRHGNMASVRDVVLMSLFLFVVRILCDSTIMSS